MNAGIVNPGASVGTLSVNGNVTMDESSHFAVEVLGGTADRLAITGNLDLNALDNYLDIIDLGLSGTSWIIGTYTGTLTGIFENITSGYEVDYGTFSNSHITLIKVDEGVDGDFNEDGIVDAADYVTWRKSGTGPLPNDNGLGTAADRYNLWTANFGNNYSANGASLDNLAAVPEPACATPFLIAAILQFTLHRSRQRPSRNC